MNENFVKENLQKIHKCKKDFSVAFTGKKSKSIFGFYKFAEKIIFIHNRNFTDSNMLMYTAIHELAHHVCATEKGMSSSVKHHTKLFWATFDDLIEEAVKKKIYLRQRKSEIEELVKEAHEIDVKIAHLRRDLGAVLRRLQDACKKNMVRVEDVISHDLLLSKASFNSSVKASLLNLDDSCGQDLQNVAIKAKTSEQALQALQLASQGKTIAQLQYGMGAPKKQAHDKSENLHIEKRRLERTISTLKIRLDEVCEKIERLAGADAASGSLFAAESAKENAQNINAMFRGSG